MAWVKNAKAVVAHRGFSPEKWTNFVGHHDSVLDRRYKIASNERSLVSRASEILGEELSLDKYLLSHTTIVASVDTMEVPNVKLGKVPGTFGRQINRIWNNYWITPETQGLINNNKDSWSREVLLASYHTFIGAYSFLEHLQLVEHAKGKIIDAVARDLGHSIYIDILVANHRKHTQLIKDIESGALNSLSMGCSVTHTQCTHCGNVAVDETDLCDCQKYQRGNSFIDSFGNQQIIAELCGNKDLDHPTKGNKFIEASWVRVPAFTGAVMRNIVQPDVININTQKQAQEILSQPPQQWDINGMQKAAFKQAFDFGDMGDDDEGGEEEDEKKEEPKEPLKDLESEIETYVLDNVRDKLRKKIKEKNQQDAATGELAVSSNDNIQKTAKLKFAYKVAVDTLTKTARSDADFVDRLAHLNKCYGINLPIDLYRAVLQVGSSAQYDKTASYIHACEYVMKRRASKKEAQNLWCLGQILSKFER